jgi:hypothetical protein
MFQMPVMPIVHKVKGFKEYMARDKTLFIPVSNSVEYLVTDVSN